MWKWLGAFVLVACGDGTSEPDGPMISNIDAAPDSLMPPAGAYAAFQLIGGLDRVVITKTVGTTCFALRLVSPAMDAMGLALPPNWGLELAQAMQPAAACNPSFDGPITDAFEAKSQSGKVEWLENGLPQAITTLNVTLDFGDPPPWCPVTEALSATNIPVQ
jgi:hypothetical protein